jgi:hypothetical protein
MDRSRKATREGNEVTLQYKSASESLLIEGLIEEHLGQLQATIEELKLTPEGLALLQRRVKAFGDCQRSTAESSNSFHQRLVHWLQQELPDSKTPLHSPRQIT